MYGLKFTEMCRCEGDLELCENSKDIEDIDECNESAIESEDEIYDGDCN